MSSHSGRKGTAAAATANEVKRSEKAVCTKHTASVFAGFVFSKKFCSEFEEEGKRKRVDSSRVAVSSPQFAFLSVITTVY